MMGNLEFKHKDKCSEYLYDNSSQALLLISVRKIIDNLQASMYSKEAFGVDCVEDEIAYHMIESLLKKIYNDNRYCMESRKYNSIDEVFDVSRYSTMTIFKPSSIRDYYLIFLEKNTTLSNEVKKFTGNDFHECINSFLKWANDGLD